MIEGQGLFQLAARSAAYASLARDKGVAHYRNVFERGDKPSAFSGQSLSALTVDANTTIRAMFQAAWEKVHSDENLISDDMLKRLEKASKSDNKEIAAERLRQAKAKLRSLRLQAQMAAASGDPKQLKRIAQQAAQAAREVASAARGLAEGIVASATPSDGSASAGNLPVAAANAPASGETPAAAPATAAVSVPTTNLFSGEREALRKLSDEAHAAIAQAKGLIAFAAQAARAKRQRPDDDDNFFRQLQQSVQDAEHDLDGALTDAGHSLDAAAESSLAGDLGTVSAIETTTLVVQVTTEVTVTANVVV
ncbi:hypothetical protein [Dongia sedimenti]|uniref:Uncharacterized protein n=1 Tax=Dongia sedimenti TaxID=3064282 RepID=A0ABU0YH42_9PROT|nr:hypothetical protein [Rhodospirillaceae bacterium R-7]